METALAELAKRLESRAEEAEKSKRVTEARYSDTSRALIEILEGVQLGLESLPTESRRILVSSLGSAYRRARELGF